MICAWQQKALNPVCRAAALWHSLLTCLAPPGLQIRYKSFIINPTLTETRFLNSQKNKQTAGTTIKPTGSVKYIKLDRPEAICKNVHNRLTLKPVYDP